MVAMIAFHPRKSEMNAAPVGEMRDGTIALADGSSLGYRLYGRPPLEDGSLPTVLVFHHGNAELATDFEGFTEPLHALGCALLVVDYRGFGWSTGTASIKKLSPDADEVAAALPKLLEEHSLSGAPLVLWGRSIGATSTVQLAVAHGDMFKGLIVESGLMDINSLPMVQQMSFMLPGGPALLTHLPDPLGTLDKLERVTIPALVMHGDQDEIVPVSQGQECHSRITSAEKTLKIFAGAGHNNVQSSHQEEYNEAFGTFIAKCRAL